jgi:hypothetical protein
VKRVLEPYDAAAAEGAALLYRATGVSSVKAYDVSVRDHTRKHVGPRRVLPRDVRVPSRVGQVGCRRLRCGDLSRQAARVGEAGVGAHTGPVRTGCLWCCTKCVWVACIKF